MNRNQIKLKDILKTTIISAIILSAATVFVSLRAEEPGQNEHSVATASDHHESHDAADSKFDLNEVLAHHLMDSPVMEWNIGGEKVYRGEPGFEAQPFIRSYVFHDEKGDYRWKGGVPMHITRRVAMLFVVAILMIVFFVGAAQLITKDPLRVNGRFAGMVETMIQYVREDIAEKNMHHHSKPFQPYILTVFFFILFANLLGLFPPVGELADITKNMIVGGGHHGGHHEVPFLVALWPGMTVTGDVAVTVTLAAFTTILIYITGFRYQGAMFIKDVVPGGVPIALFPLMWFLEFVVSPLAKGFALTVRLLANMTGGHVIILVLIGFIFQFKSLLLGVFVSVPGAAVIYLLEIFVAFLQAFIFTLLSALFIGSVMHRH